MYNNVRYENEIQNDIRLVQVERIKVKKREGAIMPSTLVIYALNSNFKDHIKGTRKLISQHSKHKKDLLLIFTWQAGKVRLVL
jgi:hypothetical protein